MLTGNQADKGGALYSFYAAIAVRNSVISNNQADEHGGAIYLYYANQDGSEPQSLLVSNSTISSNVAGTGGGGYDGGAIFSDQPAGATLIENTTISGNSADDDAGGVKVYSDDPTLGGGGGPITVSNSTISNNRSDDYAGGFAFYGGEIGNETISGVTVSGNRAAGGGGGGQLLGLSAATCWSRT